MAAIVVVAVVVSICYMLNRTNTLPSASSVDSDSTFVIGLTDEPDSLDIRTDDDPAIARALLDNVYETLVGRDNDNNLVAGLASSWDVSDDALTYTFHLRRNMTFANGDALTAADAVWSLQQIVQNKYVGYDALTNLKSVTSPDDSTLVIALSAPNPALLRVLSGRAGIVYDADQPNVDYAKQTAGSGPFTVGSFTTGKIVLERNDHYWGTEPPASQITLQYYDNETALVNDLANNVINMALPTRAASIDDAAGNPTFDVSEGTSSQKVLVAFNSASSSPLSDQQVRQAARYSLDAAGIAKSQPDALAELSGPIGQLVPGYEDLDSLFPFDIAKAKSLLAYFRADYLTTIDLIVPIRYQDLGETIQSNLESGGFSVNLEVLDAATVDSRVNSGDYDMALITMTGTNDYAQFASSDNVFHYVSGEAQQEYRDAMAATNDDDYVAGLQKFAKTVSQDAACGWLYTRKDFVVTKSRLQDYPTNFTSVYLPLRTLKR
ncbi:ABC transporter substrate-binding protein [Bifidobacterium choloepi]|uniref:ABC transporter substrate-binding protein n=1 Tax=Bifidobacterium choloepi TaxID=2614131 RepID=UPI0013D32F33